MHLRLHGGAIAFLASVVPAAPAAGLVARARAIHARVVTIDTHVDIPVPSSRPSPRGTEYGDARGLVGYAYAKAGRLAEARAIGAEVARSSTGRSMSGYVRAHYYLGVNDQERALAELEHAHNERSWLVALLKVGPLLHELRPHPRLQTLLKRMRFPE